MLLVIFFFGNYYLLVVASNGVAGGGGWGVINLNGGIVWSWSQRWSDQLWSSRNPEIFLVGHFLETVEVTKVYHQSEYCPKNFSFLIF